MNKFNQYVFDLYHYLLNLRDTMEYTIKREHKKAMYDQRKTVLTNGLSSSGSAFGNFIETNGENGEKLKAKIQEFLDDVYSDTSTVLMVSGDNVRVDDGQHVKIFDYVVNLGETLRDVLYGYIGLGRRNKDLDPAIEALVDADERLYRTVITMLILNDFKNSFFEFQKVMNESKGQPTPQSNFIVQNELSHYAKALRFVREHNHFTDNDTLDALDKCIQVIEMSEGRRDRRDNKNFPDLFKEALDQVNARLVINGPKWQEHFNKALQEMLNDIRKNSANGQA